ncbi:hypothetical protein FVEN_g170 [Fusarium venenatum]|nr:hypothetical protein FVEN_g170 [Fusarium venenatum]
MKYFLPVLGLVIGVNTVSHHGQHSHFRPDTRALNSFVHPGLLHTTKDFERIKQKVDSGEAPWSTGWDKLKAHVNQDYQPNPSDILVRGSTPERPQNYVNMYRDMAAAYALAIHWKVTGEEASADAAARVLDGWSAILTDIWGNSDKFLAAGFYGYQFANIAEILRSYSKWKGLDASIDMLLRVFYTKNHSFLTNHNDADIDNYWANWDLANIASMMSIGALADNKTVWNEAVDYFKKGSGNGAIEKAIWYLHTEQDTGKKLGQNQEAGRDQGHATLDFAMLGVIAQQGYNQGDDLFAYLDNRILTGMEYICKYNVGEEVPFATYTNAVHGTQTGISNHSRGAIRPMAEQFVAHYGSIKGKDVKWTKAYRDLVLKESGGAEGGGGDYGTTSGGYDQLGFGTLLYRLEK